MKTSPRALPLIPNVPDHVIYAMYPEIFGTNGIGQDLVFSAESAPDWLPLTDPDGNLAKLDWDAQDPVKTCDDAHADFF